MSPPQRQPTTGPGGRPRLASFLLVAGVILTLGPGPAALAERAAQAAQAAGPASTPTAQAVPGPGPPPGSAPPGAGPAGPGPAGPGSAGSGPAGPGAAWDPERVPPLRMPLAGPIVRGFDATAGTYGPGHRGVDIGGRAGQAVRAPAGGLVRFAGPVAGVTWVSLLVAPGVTATVGPLLEVEVTPGQRVRALAPVGTLGPGHGMTLHLGLRVDGVYVDPLPYLLDRPRPRLAPLLQPGGLAGPDPGRTSG
jgi:murein DD-endopeptidase MepM/ murein hydrolase activator NlpD